jgi:hypothetical protein
VDDTLLWKLVAASVAGVSAVITIAFAFLAGRWKRSGEIDSEHDRRLRRAQPQPPTPR